MVSIEDLWAEFKFRPNPNQERAILHTGGPLYLPAGPGSGKTRVLLWRTVNLIVFHGAKPDEILLSTFTEKAALQLREGLRTLLAAASNHTRKPYDTARLYVGTLHSLCHRILGDRRFYPNRGRGEAVILLDELDQYLHLARRRTWNRLLEQAGFGADPEGAINQFLGKASASRHEAISGCMSLFNRFSEECLEPTQVLREGQDPVFQKLVAMYAAYRESLVEGETLLTDFSLLQQRALELISSSPQAGACFRHVIIDEYQDTNHVQEQIIFRLAAGQGNLCVVGDDDQALYRFRGATVENFVEFPARAERMLVRAPAVIPLDINYRSREPIVAFTGQFLNRCNWTKAPPETGQYRVADKHIRAHRQGSGVAVLASAPGTPDAVCGEIADLVVALIRDKKVQDPNQVAFLYPSLKSAHVTRMKAALEARDLRVYAPRAQTFLECPEATAMLGLFSEVFGRPAAGSFGGREYQAYHQWLDRAQAVATSLTAADPALRRFVNDRQAEVARAIADYNLLAALSARQNWALEGPYVPAQMKRALAGAAGLSEAARRTLIRATFDRLVERREREGKPFPLVYVLKRATSIDWSLLDLFYRLLGFGHFITMFEAAERQADPDEGPVCNLGLLSQYISRFMDQRAPIITGALLREEGFGRLLFASYLYALYRRGESEYEDADDPFPKGRIPFLTIHQSKGLEFPVVVMGNLRKDDKGPQAVEKLVRPLLPPERSGEPLGRLASFDIMRMFYVGLSRAENLLILAHYTGQGQRIHPAFKQQIQAGCKPITALDLASLPAAEPDAAKSPRSYSYTADYLAYRRCPRQYLIFRKFEFAPSRSQTMLFGSLVHRTLDDLHQYLIARREAS
ncbi:MAG: ATP-dependent helicase [Gemmatimonadetes bacterium]|nr:ATP-dependent helicase [Gemmatimonadota bacterium]